MRLVMFVIFASIVMNVNLIAGVSRLEIISAKYGHGNKWQDVTEAIKRRVIADSALILNVPQKDPKVKNLLVLEYKLNGNKMKMVGTQRIFIHPASSMTDKLTVHMVAFKGSGSGGWQDVTEEYNKLYKSRGGGMPGTNFYFFQEHRTKPNEAMKLLVFYTKGGKPLYRCFRNGITRRTSSKPKASEASKTDTPKVSAPKPSSPKPSKPKKPKTKDSYPTKLAVNVLHAMYLWGAAGRGQWYYGKRVTVTGIVEIKDVSLITTRHLLGRKYNGKYDIPLMGDKFTAISDKPVKAPKIRCKKCRKYLVCKFTGILRKGSRYKHTILENAKLVSSRCLVHSRSKCVIPKNNKIKYAIEQEGEKELPPVKRKERLKRIGDILDWNWLELNRKVGRQICDMGLDPEGYGMELYWLEKIHRGVDFMVELQGTPDRKLGGSRLKDCAIKHWWMIKK